MKKILLTLAAALVLTMVGCGDPNVEACESFMEHWDSLECTGETELGWDCTAYEDYACDISEYFQCLEEGYQCDGETPDFDVSGCDATC